MHDTNPMLERAANQVADHLAEEVTHPAEAIKDAGDKLSDKGAAAAHSVQKIAGQVSHAIGDGYDRVSRGVSETLERGRDAARRMEHGVSDSVRHRPMISLLTAASAGIVVGFLLGRHSRD
jgi:ElaB/YqjD/DUF883 family membrane-anchored ribosome-binding protein